MDHIKITGKAIGILILGIVLFVVLLKVVGMRLLYAIPIGVGMPIVIWVAIYAMNIDQNR